MLSVKPAPRGFQQMVDLRGLQQEARRRLGRRLRRWTDSAEIVQSALRRALAGGIRLGQSAISGEWRRVVENTIRDKARFFSRRRRDAARTQDAGSSVAQIPDSHSTSPESQATRAEDEALVRAALSDLDTPDREILIAVRMEGRPLTAVAKSRGLTYAQARAALADAQARLVGALRRRGGPWNAV